MLLKVPKRGWGETVMLKTVQEKESDLILIFDEKWVLTSDALRSQEAAEATILISGVCVCVCVVSQSETVCIWKYHVKLSI